MTDKNVTPATDDDELVDLRERWNMAQALMRDVVARVKPVLGDVVLNDLSYATNEMIAVTRWLQKRVDTDTNAIRGLLAVVGPPMPCGCYAVDARVCFSPVRGTDYLYCRKHRDVESEITPEYLAWYKSRLKG